MKEIDEKENTLVTQSAESTSRKPKYVSPSILEAEKYFPTLRPRHYNWTTIKQLVALHHQESESIKFRKSMKLPYKYNQNQTVKEKTAPPKEKKVKVHPLFQNTMYNNRRTHEFFNIKKKKQRWMLSPCPIEPFCLTEP